ncbi:MAG: hypothetical protein WCX83_04535 [Candidatus Cloacimonas sp.]|nr:hypothetical protein [Candidatus Cloacimonadota bacterium]
MLKDDSKGLQLSVRELKASRSDTEKNAADPRPDWGVYIEIREPRVPHLQGSYTIADEEDITVCPFYDYCSKLENNEKSLFCLKREKLVCEKRISLVAL